jgi:hypothetical protein
MWVDVNHQTIPLHIVIRVAHGRRLDGRGGSGVAADSGSTSGIHASQRRQRRIRRAWRSTRAVSDRNRSDTTTDRPLNRRAELLPDRYPGFQSTSGNRGLRQESTGERPAVSAASKPVPGRLHAPDRCRPRPGVPRVPRDLDLGHEVPPTLTSVRESTKTGGTGSHVGGRSVTRSGRLLRQASIVVVFGCAALSAAVPALAQGPAPEPAPRTTNTPRPEPVPTARPQPPARQTTPPSPPPPPPAAPVQTQPQAVQPSPPPAPQPQPPAYVTPPPTIVRTPVVTPPPAPQSSSRRQDERRTTKKPATKPTRRVPPSRPAARRTAAAIASASSSPDTLLLIGGFALVVIILGDTIFLTLTTRYLRQS